MTEIEYLRARNEYLEKQAADLRAQRDRATVLAGQAADRAQSLAARMDRIRAELRQRPRPVCKHGAMDAVAAIAWGAVGI